MPKQKRKDDSDSEDVLTTIKKKKAGQNGSHSVEEEAVGDNENQPVFCTGQPASTPFTDVSDEEEVVKDNNIVNKCNDFSGEVLVCGGMNWDLVGRHKVPKNVKNGGGPNLWQPHRIGSFQGIKVSNVVSGCGACHSVVITEDGKAYSFGRNDKGQLGQGDMGRRRDAPTLLESLNNIRIVDGACGKNHTLLLSDTGRVFSFGDNKMGQLGLGHQTATVPSPTEVHIGEKYPDRGPIKKVACGGEFTMMITAKGTLYSFGLPEYGQLGHNTDGKYFVTSNKLSYNCEMTPRPVKCFFEVKESRYINMPDVSITDVACGTNHTIAIDHKKRVFSWGFGGYGRLGHSEQKDEMVPRLIKLFDGGYARGAVMCSAGSTFSLVVSDPGRILYLFGQNKPTGEAAMYPKVVTDVGGWNIRSIGCCNKSIVVVADSSVISWGPSPTYGELGYGEHKPKSSTRAEVMKSMEGMHIHKVACGYGHCILIAKCDTDEEKADVDKQKVFTPNPVTEATA
ncbi:protein RCC2 homolog [Lineus longissimus]|uniref:protein RCC2 homolog n=1 Tax=Lineus longissimus TaxID=88925 RepID=UPI002B4C9CD0